MLLENQLHIKVSKIYPLMSSNIHRKIMLREKLSMLAELVANNAFVIDLHS